MTSPVIVIGHKNPDTDSMCSAYAYAYLKGQITGNPYVAGRCGNLNKETQFVFDQWGVEPPSLILDVFNRVSDLLTGDGVFVPPNATLREVGALAQSREVKSLPVVDGGQLVGLVTLGDIAKRYLGDVQLNHLEDSHITLENLKRTLGGRLIVTGKETVELKGKVVIAASHPDTLGKKIQAGDTVIIGDRPKAQLAAVEAEAGVIIVTSGFAFSDEAKAVAESKGIPVLSVPYDTFGTARMIDMSTAVSHIMHSAKEVVSFSVDDLVEDVRKKMLETRFRSYPVLDKEGKFLGTISRNHLLGLKKKQVILTDHNEKSQAVDGIEQAQILEVVDHHRLGDISTGEPIYFRNEPVGCSCTIVASIYEEQGLEIPKAIAGLLASAILSDTVIFKSPTCTPKDKAICEKLCRIAGIDPYEYGKEMFKAGSSLAGRTPEQIVFEDFKAFPMGDYKVGIGQVSTMDLDTVRVMLPSIKAEMKRVMGDKGLHQCILMVTDILAEGTELVAVGDRLDMVERAFNCKLQENTAWLEGVMSRKKQIVPPLTEVFTA